MGRGNSLNVECRMSNSELQMEGGAVNGVAKPLDAAEVDTLLTTVGIVACKMRACVPARGGRPARVLGQFPAKHEPMVSEILAVIEKYAPRVKLTTRDHYSDPEGCCSFICQWIKIEEGKR